MMALVTSVTAMALVAINHCRAIWRTEKDQILAVPM